MRKNTVREIWARDGAVINGWCSIPSSFSAEIMAHQAFDSITIDMQHGLVDYQVAVTMLQAISTTPVIPLTRIPWNDPAWLMKDGHTGTSSLSQVKLLRHPVDGAYCPLISVDRQGTHTGEDT